MADRKNQEEIEGSEGKADNCRSKAPEKVRGWEIQPAGQNCALRGCSGRQEIRGMVHFEGSGHDSILEGRKVFFLSLEGSEIYGPFSRIWGQPHTHTHTHIHTHTHTPLVYTCTVPGAHTRCIISFLKQNTILGVEVSCLLR